MATSFKMEHEMKLYNVDDLEWNWLCRLRWSMKCSVYN